MKPFNLVALGRFLNGNSVSVAIKAYAKFYHGVSSKYQKKVHLTLIDKRYHHDLNMGLVLDYKLVKCVSMLSLQEQEKIEETYKNGSLLLLARKENSTSIIKEAFLYGLPVLCYANASYTNLIDASNSMSVDYKSDDQSVNEFAKFLDLLNFDPDVLDILRKGAMKKYERDLSWGKRASAG